MKNSIAIMIVAAAGSACSVFAQTGFPELEPNETKAQATPVVGIVAGDAITGNTIGALATPGPDSLDTFRIKTAALPAGIYRHRLMLTTKGTAGHTGSLRGLSQTNGIINAGTDIAIQTTNGGTNPSRFSQWYGFGRQEEVYYRVTGAATTTGNYTSTLETATVTPVVMSTQFLSGPMTITTVGQTGATQVDTDLVVYDANLAPVAGFSNDDEPAPGTTLGSKLMRSFAPGTYYLAISNFNVCNNRSAPADDSNRQAPVMDFPDGVANSSISPANVSFRISDSAIGNVLTTVTKSSPYDVLWYQFVVVAPALPCYANCDESTAAPILNVNDFQCFLNAYAVGTSYANCDNSTSEPVLNVNDFQCFLNAFAVGCS